MYMIMEALPIFMGLQFRDLEMEDLVCVGVSVCLCDGDRNENGERREKILRW